MAVEIKSERLTILGVEPSATIVEMARAVEAGLRSSPKRIPCRFFYDDAGSRLFEEICALPEYYLTRAEDEILEQQAGAIAEAVPIGCDLVELGSGSAQKTRRLIRALLGRSPRLRYVPIDISKSALVASAESLLAKHAGLSILGIAAEYEEGLEMLRKIPSRGKLVLWLGSNVGNVDRPIAAEFLARVASRFSAEDRLLIGIDLRKERGVLERAYDDSKGVTARFNRNVLVRLNAELGADFDPESFRHVAFYDELRGRIEMHLESTRAQSVEIDQLGLRLELGRGERIHTEDSYKYSSQEIGALARGAGLRVAKSWLDREERFSLNLLAPAL